MALIVHPSKRCAGTVTFKGGPARYKFLNDLFKDNNLIDQAKASPFGQFFSGLEYQFCGQLVHALMLRKVRSSRANEIQFLLGDSVCKFGQGEFGLVSGLRFGPDYSDEEWNKYTTSPRLIIKHFENSQKIHISTLEAALKVCEDVDDIWKLGLVYFVEGVLLGMDKSYVVPTKFICLADYPEKFLSYPWGERAWSTTFKSLKKDMLHFYEKPLDNRNVSVGNVVDNQAHEDPPMKKRKKNREKVDAKYTLIGWIPCLQYWAFEAVVQFGKKFASYVGEASPRMLSWTNTSSPTTFMIIEDEHIFSHHLHDY